MSEMPHYDENYFLKGGFCHNSYIDYGRKEKLFNLAWASKWSGINLLSGKGMRALDAGCGTGWNSFILNELGYQTVGMDISDFAITQADNKAKEMNLQNMEWIHFNLDTEEITGTFDLIICWEVIEHLTDPFKVLQKLWKALKPGGILVLTTPNKLGLSEFLFPKDPTHIHVHSTFWWARQLRRLHPQKYVCRSFIFWDHVLPWLRKRKNVIAHWFPILGFRVRMALIK